VDPRSLVATKRLVVDHTTCWSLDLTRSFTGFLHILRRTSAFREERLTFDYLHVTFESRCGISV